MLSVIIPLYNKEKTIRRTVESVLNQSFSDIEVIVIDDGSTDNSVGQIENIHDPRLRIIRQSNGGVSSARNHGIRASKGEWLYFIDADDFICAEKGFSIFNNGILAGADMVVANFNCITDNGIIPYCKYQTLEGFIKNPHKSHYLAKCFFQAGSFIVKRDIALRNPFDLQLRRYEDSDAYFRWAAVSHVYWTPCVIFSSDRRFSNLAIPNPMNWNSDFAFHLSWNFGFWRNLCQSVILQEAVIAYPDKKNLLKRNYGIKGKFYLFMNKIMRKLIAFKKKLN